jgi:hypothetical protein
MPAVVLDQANELGNLHAASLQPHFDSTPPPTARIDPDETVQFELGENSRDASRR